MSNGNTIERISDDFNVMWQGIAQDLNLDVDPEYATKGTMVHICLLLLTLFTLFAFKKYPHCLIFRISGISEL